jgi:magnesium transporter
LTTEAREETATHERGTAPTAELVRAVEVALEADDNAKVRALLADVHGPDLADLIELLGPDERVRLIQALGSDFDFEVLTEVDEKVRDQISEALPNDVLAKAVTDLESDDAAYLLGGLEESDQKEILAQLSQSDRPRCSAICSIRERRPAA